LLDHGDIDLPSTNPDVEAFRERFDPAHLWTYLQNESDLSNPGLYLSLYCNERPTFDGKRWFIYTAYNAGSGGMRQETSREVRWVEVKGLQFWNSSFRDYARIHQGRGIVDYSMYVSRCFGYCFLLGMTYSDEDEEERREFTIFYPSVHHYHNAVAINEQETYQPFHDDLDWYSKNYTQDSDVEPSITIEGAANMVDSLAGAANRISQSIGTWSDEVATSNLDNLADLGEDIMEEED
jgi:hypothetical protein